ncbi:hypothetical protein BST61_g5592 [Cercospora zeina]
MTISEAGWIPFDLSPPRASLQLELFTTPDSSCPWEMIGSTLEQPGESGAGFPYIGGTARVVPVDAASPASQRSAEADNTGDPYPRLLIRECLDSINCECGTLETFVGNRALAQRRYVLDVPRDIDIQPEQLARGRALATKYDMDDLPDRSHLGAFFRNGLRDSELNDYAFMKRHSEGRYLAGLWEADLLRGLLWVWADINDGMEVLRPKGYLAPSWSWASVRRPVDWLSTEPKPAVYHASIRALIGQEVLCVYWCVDMADTRTGRGWDRCLVLKDCDTGSNTFTRIGIMSSLPPEGHSIFASAERNQDENRLT